MGSEVLSLVGFVLSHIKNTLIIWFELIHKNHLIVTQSSNKIGVEIKNPNLGIS